MKATTFHRGLLLLAGLLLSLHSFVPHVHGDHPGDSGQETAKNTPPPQPDLLTLLQNIFTDTDLGEDHLEHFAADHDTTLDLEISALRPPAALPPAIVLVASTTPVVVRRQRIFRQRHFPPSGVYPDATAPRGPPTLV